MKRLMVISVAAIVSLWAATAATADDDDERRPGRDRDAFRQMMIERFDTDGDGKLDDEERAKAREIRQMTIERFDTDGDGKLPRPVRKCDDGTDENVAGRANVAEVASRVGAAATAAVPMARQVNAARSSTAES